MDGDSMYVMVLQEQGSEWTCLTRSKSGKAAMPSWRKAVRRDSEYFRAEMVAAGSVQEARELAEQEFAETRRRMENPTCPNCKKPVETYGECCSVECYEEWDATAAFVSKMSAAMSGAVARPKQ